MRGHLFLPIGKFRKSKRQNKRRFCFSTYFSESFTNVIPTMNLLCPYGLLCSPVGVLKVSEVTPFPSSSSCASVGDPWLQNSGGSRSGVQHGAAVQAVSRGVTQGTPFPPDLSRLPHLERICCSMISAQSETRITCQPLMMIFACLPHKISTLKHETSSRPWKGTA